VAAAKTGERWLTGLSFAVFLVCVGILAHARRKRR
jgi:hypothetical protein